MQASPEGSAITVPRTSSRCPRLLSEAPGVGAGQQGPWVWSALSCAEKALQGTWPRFCLRPERWPRAVSERLALAFLHGVHSPADRSRPVPQQLPACGWTRDLKHSLSREHVSSRGPGHRSLWISLPEAVSGGLGGSVGSVFLLVSARSRRQGSAQGCLREGSLFLPLPLPHPNQSINQ